MKRSDVIDAAPENIDEVEDFVSKVKEFIDYCESKFNDIARLLEDINIDRLDNIIDAKDIADSVGTDLY